MRYISTLFLLSYELLIAFFAQAQEPINPSRVRWTTSLPATTTKSLVDGGGNTWSLSGVGTFQVVDSQGKLRWSKQLTALTVADFTVDTKGQLLLVGLPATGRPVLEKYDASQTLAWRNTLDSLSNATNQANKLSVTVGAAGSGIVLGLNATSDRTLSYYFFQPGGKLGSVVSLKGTAATVLALIKPIVYNQTDILFGLSKAGELPSFYRLKADSLVSRQVYQESVRPKYPSEFAEFQPSVVADSSLVVFPLLTNGTSGYSFFKSRASQYEVSPQTPLAYQLTKFYYYPQSAGSNPVYAAATNNLRAPLSTFAAIGQATSHLIDSQNRLYTIQLTNNPTYSSTTTSRLLLNEYQLDGLQLISSTEIGVAINAASDPARQICQLTLLKNSNGILLISGITNGTMTVGQSRFTATTANPIQFLTALSPENPAQVLTADQQSWAASLPATAKALRSNSRQQSWIQLPDSTFRFYDANGRQLWQKKLETNGLYDFGADSKANLYLVGADTVSCFDSTGTISWKYSAGYKGTGQRRSIRQRQLSIAPSGGGIVASMEYVSGSESPTELITDEFSATGRPLGVANRYYGIISAAEASLRNKPLQLSNRFRFTVNNGWGKWGPYSENFSVDYFIDKKTLVDLPLTTGGVPFTVYLSPPKSNTTHGTVAWSGTDGTNTYTVVNHLVSTGVLLSEYFYAYGFVKYDLTGNKLIDEFNTPRVNTLALAKTRAVSPNGTLFAITTNPTATTSMVEVVLNEYAPNLDLRNTTRLGSYTVLSGQTDQTSWELAQAYTDGSMLLSGVTNGTLTIGANTYAGTTADPARFLTLIHSTVAQVTTPTTAICSGAPALLRARYKGYLTRVPVIELATSAGTLVQRITLPLSQSALVDSTLSRVSLPTPATLATGTYQVRTMLESLVSPWSSLTVLATPAPPETRQEGDELVASSTSGTLQWYDGQRQAITGATSSRFRPQVPGTYYAVNTVNGCASAFSTAATVIFLATEPATQAIMVYPNPASDRLYVRWPGAGAGAQIQVLNSQGRVLQRVARQGEVTDVSLTGLSANLLLVHLQEDGQPTQVYKVVLQRP